MPDHFETLLKGCRNYDRKAQRQMVDLLAPFLLSVCRRYETAFSPARDLAQEALILIFNHIEDCREEEKIFIGWCRRIAVNVCLEKFRKRRLPVEGMEQYDDKQGAEPEVFGYFDVESILKMLNFLPENQRLVFNMYVIDGYSHAEIGEFMSCKESTSRTLLVRARAALQEMVTKKEFLNDEYGAI